MAAQPYEQFATQPPTQIATQPPAQLTWPATSSDSQVNGSLQTQYYMQHATQHIMRSPMQPAMQRMMQWIIQHALQPAMPSTMQPTVQLSTHPAVRMPTFQRPMIPFRLRSEPPKAITRRFLSVNFSPPREASITFILMSPSGYFVDFRLPHPVVDRDPGTLPDLPWPAVLPLPHVYGCLIKPTIYGEGTADSKMFRVSSFCAAGGMTMTRILPDRKVQIIGYVQVWNRLENCKRVTLEAFKIPMTEVGEDGEICNWVSGLRSCMRGIACEELTEPAVLPQCPQSALC